MNSDPKIKHFGIIRNGIRIYHRPVTHASAIDALEGQEFEETLAPRFIKTTEDQHGYYRASLRWLITEIESFAGWDEDRLHEAFMNKFEGQTVVEEIHYPNGNKEIATFRHVPKMSTFSKKRTSKYIEKLWAHLASEGIYIPEADAFSLGRYKTRIKKVKHESNKE